MSKIIIAEKMPIQIPELEGIVTVELINDRGEIVHHEEGHNFIAAGAYDWLKKSIRCFINAWLPNNVATAMLQNTYGTSFESGFFRNMLLLDDATAEDPVNEVNWKGNIIGWGQYSTYAGSDLKGGTIYHPECHCDNNHFQICWEFANDRANGTFQSVALTRSRAESEKDAREYPLTIMHSEIPLARAYNLMCDDGSYYWGWAGGNLIWRIDKTTHQEVAQFTLPEVPIQALGLTFYDGGLIYGNGTNDWRKYTISTGITTTVASTYWSYTQIMKAAGLIGPVMYGFSNNTDIWRLDLSSGTPVMEMKSIPPASRLTSISSSCILNDKFLLIGSRSDIESGKTVLFEVDWETGIPSRYTGVEFRGDGAPYSGMQLLSTKEIIWPQQGMYHAAGGNAGYFLCKIQNLNEPRIGSLQTRKRLASPVVKTSEFKMRVKYRINYTV